MDAFNIMRMYTCVMSKAIAACILDLMAFWLTLQTCKPLHGRKQYDPEGYVTAPAAVPAAMQFCAGGRLPCHFLRAPDMR